MTRMIRCHRSIGGCFIIAVAAAYSIGCATSIYPDFHKPVVCRIESPVANSVFLIGDTGHPILPKSDVADPDALIDPVLSALALEVQERVAALGAESTAVVFLGDNVYPAGMPPEGEEGRERAVRVLEAQIAAAGEARGLFLFGNHDWDQSKAHGWIRAREQYDYLSMRAANISVHPANTCPGPDFVDLSDDLRIVFFDFWSAVYQKKHPGGPLSHCTLPTNGGNFVPGIKATFDSAGGRRVVFAAHPPLITAGPHGGYFPWKEHLFPLRVFNRNLWLPLPVIGSIFPLARELGLAQVDITNHHYRGYVLELLESMEPGLPALVVGGHEHSLQIHVGPVGVFHAVSGAGSTYKVDYVRDMNSELMAVAAPGFMRLDLHEDKRMRLNVTAIDDEDVPHRVFSTCIP